MNAFELKINKYLNQKTIKEVLSFFHLGKDKIKDFSLNNSFFVNDNLVDINYVVKEND